MSDYDYGNARLHVMKSRLLPRSELEGLAGSGSLPGLIAALTKTVYQKSIEAALTRATGIYCIDDALRNNLISTIGKLRSFYTEDARGSVAIVLRAYDIHNLKAILRGLSKNVPVGDILTILLPIGELNLSVLRELAQLNNPREAIDLLASMGLAFAWPLLNLRAEVPGAEIFQMELALDKWHHENAHQCLRGDAGRTDSLSRALTLEADLMNVLTALRFAQTPHERDLLRNRLGTNELGTLYIGPGRISYEVFLNACLQDSVPAAVETLSETFFGQALHTGLEAYLRSNRLSDIERQLRRHRLAWMAEQFIKDPLGIGVVLGYVALKTNEVGNIRWITQGINLGLKEDAIRTELEMVS